MTEAEKKKKVTAIKEPEIQDIDLGFVEKKKFRIGGDYNRIVELNVSDMNIFARYKTTYPKLNQLLQDAQKKVSEIQVDDDSADFGELSDTLTEIDREMRDLVDYLFDSPVSDVCAPSGNMFDPVDGEFRFEKIIGKLSELYTTGFTDEIAKFKSRTAKHTNKYTKKYHK